MTNSLSMVKDLISSSLPDAQVQVSDLTGTSDHLGILVISDVFKGKALLEQHQIIMDILRQSLQERVHAVKIKTMTHEAYEKAKAAKV